MCVVRLLCALITQAPRRGWGWGGFSPPTFLAVDVRTLNVQLEIFKVLMKDGEFTCFDDILAKIKQLSEAKKCMITEIITLCKLLLVNPATSAPGERSFSIFLFYYIKGHLLHLSPQHCAL